MRRPGRVAFLTNVLAVVAVLALLGAGCGGGSDEQADTDASGGSEAATTAAETAAPAEEAAPAETAASESQETTSIKVAYANEAANFTPLFAAIGEGIFEANGLDVEPVLTGRGGQAPALLQADEVQFALDSGEPMITAIARGADIVMIGATGNRFGFVLLARKPISDVEDLRGKKLALSSPTGAVGTAGKELLSRYNLTDDVEVVYIADIATRLSALGAGSVDAIILSPPVHQLMSTGDFNQVLDLRPEFRFLLVGIWATRNFVTENPEIAEAFIRSMNEAITFLKDPANEEAALEYLEDATGFEDEESLRETYEYEILNFQDDVSIDLEALENSMTATEEHSDITAPDPDSFILEPSESTSE